MLMSFRTAFQRSQVALFAALTGLSVDGASPTPAPRDPGDKIEFSVPRETGPLRPPAGQELERERFGSSRRDPTPADGANIISSMPLPPATDVNRLRMLQELLGRRRGDLDSFDAGSRNAVPGMKLDDRAEVEGSATRMSIDDLFDRQRGGFGADDRGGDDGRRPGTNREDRSGRDRDRERDRDRDPEAKKADGSLGRDNRDGEGTKARPGDSAQDQRFLPSLRARDDDFQSSLRGRRRDGDERSPETSDRLTGRSGFGLRDVDDPMRGREERMESFRRMLGGGTTVDSWISPGSRTALGDSKPSPGGLAVPGASTSSARTLGAVLDARGGGAGAGTPAGEATADRTFSMPSRPLDLNLGSGRSALGIADGSGAVPAPALKPMELFQRKHETRIPTRGF